MRLGHRGLGVRVAEAAAPGRREQPRGARRGVLNCTITSTGLAERNAALSVTRRPPTSRVAIRCSAWSSWWSREESTLRASVPPAGEGTADAEGAGTARVASAVTTDAAKTRLGRGTCVIFLAPLRTVRAAAAASGRAVNTARAWANGEATRKRTRWRDHDVATTRQPPVTRRRGRCCAATCRCPARPHSRRRPMAASAAGSRSTSSSREHLVSARLRGGGEQPGTRASCRTR